MAQGNADENAGKEAAEVRSVIYTGLKESVCQIEGSPQQQGEQHRAYHASRKRQLTDIKGRDQCARYAEQCSRSTGADGQRIPQKSGETTDDSSEDVSGEVGETTVECFRKSTEDDQRPHVSDEMSNTDMNEDVREKAPRLSTESERTEIATPLHHLIRCG